MNTTYKIHRRHPIAGSALLVALQLYLFLYGCNPSVENTRQDYSPKALYSSKCASCHRLIEAKEHPPEVWRRYVYTYGRAMPIWQQQMLIEYLQHESADR